MPHTVSVSLKLNTEQYQDLSPILDAFEDIMEGYLADLLPDLEETDYVSDVTVYEGHRDLRPVTGD
jgi:hypothetical protein